MTNRTKGNTMIDIIFALLFAAFPACATEDSTNCAWNAHTQGNGQGHSLINIGDHSIRIP